MTKGIFFDAGGVLYNRPESTASYALKLLKKKGLPTEISTQNFKRLEALHVQASQGKINHDTYWDHFLRMRGITDPKLRKSLTEQFIDYSNDVLPVPGCRETLAGLKQRGFILGIVTDTMYPIEWKMRRLNKAGVAEFIDVVACSTVLGAHKPDPSMYLNALKQANLTPRESAFVGHAAIELEGAYQAGLTTVAVNYDPDAQADFCCQAIIDLLKLPIFQRIG